MTNNRALKVVPTLVIGLGGTGALGVQYIKRKIQHQLRNRASNEEMLKKIPFVEYLVLDTTPQEEFIEELTGDETINMGHKNISRVIGDIERKPEYGVLSWFPKNIDPGQIDSGARGVRAIGRLCFFLSKPVIEKSLRNKVTRITSYTEVDRVLKENFKGLNIEPASSISVHLVTSLCGGTGSACLLEVAYLIKHIIEEITEQGANCVAHIVTIEPFGSETGIGRTTQEYLNYNFAISLSEIEHFNKYGKWEVEYLDKSKVASREKPFNLAFMLGNKEGESLSKKQICEIIGETIALTSVYPESRYLKGQLDNPQAHVINAEDTSGKLKTYSSYNTRILTAQLDAQTLEASKVKAGQTVIDTLCERHGELGDPQTLFENLKNAIFASNIGISRIGFDWFRNWIQQEINVSPGEFAAIPKQIRKVSQQFTFRKGKGIQQQDVLIERAGTVYDGLKKELDNKASALKSSMVESFTALQKFLDKELRTTLFQGDKSLPCVDQLVELISNEIKTAIEDLEAHKRSLGDPNRAFEKEMADSIRAGGGQYTELAIQRINVKVLLPAYESLEALYRKLLEFVNKRKEWCEEAYEFLKDTKELLQEERVREYSYTTHSIWTREIVANKIKSIPIKKTLINRFYNGVENKFNESLEMNERSNDEIAFLTFLGKREMDRKRTVARILREVSGEVISNEIQSSTINFNLDEKGTGNPAMETDRIHEFVESASPVWQIERGGEDIMEVSVTNCPKNSTLGEIITRLGKNIAFSESGESTSELLVFRSEHGVSIRRLLKLKEAMAAARRKLLREKKHSMNDLCLDPKWQIENPVPLEKVDLDILWRFSLGMIFGFIIQKPNWYYFSDGAAKEVRLTTSIDPSRSALRSEAYSGFLKLKTQNEEQWKFITKKIEDELSNRRSDDYKVVDFKTKIHQEIDNLQRLKHEAKAEADKLQLDDEISALNECVIQPLNDYISEKGIKGIQ